MENTAKIENLEEIKYDGFTKEQLIEKYKELDGKVDDLLNKIKIRRIKNNQKMLNK